MDSSSPVEYDSASRRPAVVEEFLELLRYRDLLRLLVANSIKTRYKRSVLGVMWTLLNPLLTTAVLAIAFSALFRFSVQNYPIYLLAGLIFWNFFSQTTTVAMGSLVWGGSLIKRIYVPRTIFSVAAIGNGLINLCLALIPLFIMMAIYGQPFRAAMLLLPVSILLMAMFALGVALFMATLAVFFVDVVDMYGILLTAWFYLTPIIYPPDIFPESLNWILRLNPVYNLLEMFRSPIYLGRLPGAPTVLASAAWAVIAMVAGWWAFTRKADDFAYRV